MCAICSADADFLAFAIFVWLNIGQTIGKMRQHGSKVYISGQLISLPKLTAGGRGNVKKLTKGEGGKGECEEIQRM